MAVQTEGGAQSWPNKVLNLLPRLKSMESDATYKVDIHVVIYDKLFEPSTRCKNQIIKNVIDP